MGRSLLADIPGPHQGPVIANASIASGGGNSVISDWVVPANIKITSVWRTVDADEATHGTASTSASFRRHRLLNGGSAGTATTILASLNQTVSQASKSARAFTVASIPTASAGDVLVLDQVTVGAADNDGTVVQSGRTHIAYELL